MAPQILLKCVVVFPLMKTLASLFLVLSSVCCFAQKTVSVPIIVSDTTQTSPAVTASDLKVEVNHETGSVVSLESLAKAHLQYELVYDQRNHDRWPGDAEQELRVAAKFLNEVISRDSDVGTLVGYADDVFLDEENKTDSRKLAHSLRTGALGEKVRLYDAVTAAANHLRRQESEDHTRKVIFLICDGTERGSKVSSKDSNQVVQKFSIPVFIFAPAIIEKTEKGRALRDLADRSGARVYFLSANTKNVTFAGVKQDLANSFLLTLSRPSSTGVVPLKVTDSVHPQTQIASPTEILITE